MYKYLAYCFLLISVTISSAYASCYDEESKLRKTSFSKSVLTKNGSRLTMSYYNCNYIVLLKQHNRSSQIFSSANIEDDNNEVNSAGFVDLNNDGYQEVFFNTNCSYFGKCFKEIYKLNYSSSNLELVIAGFKVDKIENYYVTSENLGTNEHYYFGYKINDFATLNINNEPSFFIKGFYDDISKKQYCQYKKVSSNLLKPFMKKVANQVCINSDQILYRCEENSESIFQCKHSY